MEMQKEYPMTKEGFEKLEVELEHLKTVRRPEVVEKLKLHVVLVTFQRTQNTMLLKMSKALLNRKLLRLK